MLTSKLPPYDKILRTLRIIYLIRRSHLTNVGLQPKSGLVESLRELFAASLIRTRVFHADEQRQHTLAVQTRISPIRLGELRAADGWSGCWRTAAATLLCECGADFESIRSYIARIETH